MSVKFQITTSADQLEAISQWLQETAGRIWLTFKGDAGWISGVGYMTHSYLTFRRESDAMEFYLTWHGRPDVWIEKRYDRLGHASRLPADRVPARS